MKPDKSDEICHSDREELIEAIYKLGFEVGYFKHNEDGWVGRKYTEIRDLSNKIGLDIDIEDYYQAAKNEGIKKRRYDVVKGLSGKSEPTEENEKIKTGSSQSEIKSDKKLVSGKKPKCTEFNSPVKKPEYNSKPGVLKRVKVMDLPELLH
jgi:hypothetical protein